MPTQTKGESRRLVAYLEPALSDRVRVAAVYAGSNLSEFTVKALTAAVNRVEQKIGRRIEPRPEA